MKVLALGVRDLEASLALYRDGLGLATAGIIGTGFDGDAVFFFATNGGLILALYPKVTIVTDANLPTRIHIIGRPGSGKTTLAQQLSDALHIPWYDLDVVAYEGGFGKKIPLEMRMTSLQQISAQPAWITEGVFLWWTEVLFDAADVIVWLDLPFYINGWRIVTRHMRLSWAGTNRHPGLIKLLRFLVHVTQRQLTRTAIVPRSADDDGATTGVATSEFLRAYRHKTVRCVRPAEVARFKARLLAGEFKNGMP